MTAANATMTGSRHHAHRGNDSIRARPAVRHVMNDVPNLLKDPAVSLLAPSNILVRAHKLHSILVKQPWPS